MSIDVLRRRLLKVSMMGVAALAVGCGDDTPLSSPTAPSGVPGDGASAASEVRLRVAHLSPDAPAVDVWVDGERVLEGVSFPQFSDYLAVSAGEHRIQVTPAGDSSTIVIDTTLPFAAGGTFTVAATGLLSAGDLQPLVIGDDPGVAAGARVRFLHAGPDAPGVDIAVAGGDVIFPDVTFRESSGYAEIPGGTYDLEVRVAGTSAVALAVPGVSVAGGTNYTIYAIGRLSDGSLQALPVVDAR